MSDTTMEPPQSTTPTNPWLNHVRKYQSENPGKSWKNCLKEAKSTYSPVVTEKPKDQPKAPNPWMVHIDNFKKQHPDWKEKMTYKDVLVLCKATYSGSDKAIDSTGS